MTEDAKTPLIRVPKEIHVRIGKRALRNFRSIPKEVEYLLNTVEKLEKQKDESKLAYTEEA